MTEIFADLFDRVYVVSLPRSQDRRSHIRRHFAEIGLRDYEFHDAMAADAPAVTELYAEGRVASYPPCFRCGKLECGRDDCNNVLIPPQVAVFASYLDLWRKIAARGERVLICEDDVAFHPWHGRVLLWLKGEIAAGRLAFEAARPALLRFGWALNPDHDGAAACAVTRQVRMANPCHAVTSAYAQALLQEFERVDQTADVFQHQKARIAGQASWTVMPPIASELSWSTGEMESLIHPKTVHVDRLRAIGDDDGATRHEERIKSHFMHIFHRKFLLVGHPRCGLGPAAQLLRGAGFDIGCEANGKDGLASWSFAVDDLAPGARDKIAQRRAALHWECLVMACRNVAEAVPAILDEDRRAPASYAYRRKHVLARCGIDLDALPSDFARAVVSWLCWNEIMLEMKPNFIFRVEEDGEALVAFARQRYGCEGVEAGGVDPATLQLDEAAAPAIGPADWAALPEEIWDRVVALCRRLGYTVPDRSNPLA